MKIAIKAAVETVCLVNGRLSGTSIFDQVFAPYLNE
jgi:acyl-CoA thioester hydrolase